MATNRFTEIVKRIVAQFAAPAPGRGRLVKYKGKEDSWILNQMKTKKVDPGIVRSEGKNGQKFKTNKGKV